MTVWSQDEKSGFAFIILFDCTEWVADRMQGVFFGDAVFPSTRGKLHGVNIVMTPPSVNMVMTSDRMVAMLTSVFEQLFRHLVGAFMSYEDAPRTPESVSELGASRWDLELARNAIAVERERLTAHPSHRAVVLRKTATSDDELAQLRVFGHSFSR